MNYKSNLLLFLPLVLLLIFSCTKQVDYLLEGAESVPVIQSIMLPDSVVTVYVSQSNSTFNNKYSYVADAKVLLYCNDVLVDTLQFNLQDKYCSNVYPEAGKKYKVAVQMPNGNEVWGETTIPSKPDSCYPLFTSNVLVYEGDTYGDLELIIKDSPLVSNYYELLVFDTAHFSNIYSDYWEIYEIDPVVLNEGDWGYNPYSIYFSDELFRGKKYGFKCTIRSGVHTSGTIEHDQLIDKAATYLKNISYSYYKYRKSYTRHISNAGIQSDGVLILLYIGDPVDMYSNVNGGLGVIASYNGIVEKIKKKP